MNKQGMFVALGLLMLPILAHASCDTVKADIDAKIQAKGVSHYALEVVAADQAPADGKVVGHCEGDKQIVYTRGGGAGSTPAHHTKNDADKHTSEPASAASSGD